jgi:hypothetical protein
MDYERAFVALVFGCVVFAILRAASNVAVEMRKTGELQMKVLDQLLDLRDKLQKIARNDQ